MSRFVLSAAVALGLVACGGPADDVELEKPAPGAIRDEPGDGAPSPAQQLMLMLVGARASSPDPMAGMVMGESSPDPMAGSETPEMDPCRSDPRACGGARYQ